MRLCLFTDTLGDVNGVSRFIRTIGEQALLSNLDLHIITSTRFECPRAINVHNIPPRYSRPMPGYPTLDVVIPRSGEITRLAQRLNPDAVHVSTPGPVGAVGRRFALKRRLPLLGTYHTDFPAYIGYLFNDDALTWTCSKAMRRFYAPFHRIFSRSDNFTTALNTLGLEPARVARLLPGIDTDVFNTTFADPTGVIWKNHAEVRQESTKVLYVGRVSVEKNLPLLARLWPRAASLCNARGIDTQLLIVGDGPYRQTMTAELQRNVPPGSFAFLGFRHGLELSTLYASSDLFAFPSTTDTLGQVVMEAQASGLPVLVTDQGGPHEMVDHASTGFVLSARPMAENTWAEAISLLACNATLRRQMSTAAAAKIAPMSIRHTFKQFWDVHAEHAKFAASHNG